MDVLYILGKGSLAENEEIRYSVRSLEQHMLDLGNVFIVGENPGILPNAIQIECEDPHTKAWRNMLLKLRTACAIEGLSEEFILMNDDFFLLAPVSGEEFPFYAVENGNGGSSGALDFGVHAPIKIKKEWLLNMPLLPDASGSFSVRSFYGNFYKAPPTYTKDHIMRAGEGLPSFDEQSEKWDWFSIDDAMMLNPEFISWLQSKFPEPSSFEIEQ